MYKMRSEKIQNRLRYLIPSLEYKRKLQESIRRKEEKEARRKQRFSHTPP
jgi:hypothetical protein